MIKDFQQFSKEIESSLSKVDKHLQEADKEKSKITIKYKMDICDTIIHILDDLRKRFGVVGLLGYLYNEKSKHSIDFLNKLQGRIMEFKHEECTLEHIEYMDGVYTVAVHDYSDTYREYTFYDADTISLYEFFKDLLKYYSTITNPEIFKKLNEMSNNISSHLGK